MTTAQVIARFLDGQSASNGRISTDGTNLYSYSTVIAFTANDNLFISQETYSNTTARHLSELQSQIHYPALIPDRASFDVTVRVEDSASFQYSLNGRKGSIGYRRLDAMPPRMTVLFSQVVPHAV